MTAERWEQVKQIYDSALKRAALQRAAYLDQVCAGDAALRGEVESLLVYETRADNFIEAPALEVAAGLLTPEPASSAVGRQIGPYQVCALLGAGGMGEVYLAEDSRLGRKVALKLLPARFTQDTERVRRFEREARAASALNHPNIVTIHEIGQVDDVHYIVTEYIEGQTLRRVLAAQMKLPAALDIAVQAASALSAAHEVGIVHRDIKPENIMLRPDGYIKVLDFGLAKLTELQAPAPDDKALTVANSETEAGVVMGTVGYMSPEQVRGQKVDARTDIFSLGVVLYEMLAGRAPFAGATNADVIAAVLQTEPLPLARHSREVPETLGWIVTKALRKERAERYQTIKDLLLDLKRLKQELELEASLKRQTRAKAVGKPKPASYETTRAKPAAQRRPARKVITSLAILPLANLSDDANLEYFSDGITESIINALAQLPKLRVTACSTVFRYKGQAGDPQAIGRQLGAQAVLTGRVRQVEDRLTISTELIDVATDAQLWGEHYNRRLSDIFAVQEEIAGEISEKLRLRLSRAEKQRLAKRYTENTEAYHLYLKGRYHWNKRSEEALHKALECFKQAIEIDPNYALAYAGLADAYTYLGDVGITAITPKEAFAKGRAAAAKALEIDETLAEAHASLAHLSMHHFQWSEAETQFKRALELKPNYATAHQLYAYYLIFTGRADEALTEIARALELDPLSVPINADVGELRYFARQYEQALEQLHKLLELDPRYYRARLYLARVYEQKQMYEEAITELQKAVELSEQNTDALASLAHGYAVAGKRTEALDLLAQLNELAKRKYIPPYDLALIHAELGEPERAFEWLDKAYAERAEWMIYTTVDPRLDRLRRDPRFSDLVQRVGLAPFRPQARQEEASIEQAAKAAAGQSSGQATTGTIAVLPFKPLSAEGRDEYLELGIADALITKLSNLSRVVLRPTSLVRKYTALEQDSIIAGRELQVEWVLEGSIQKLADRIRVTARLVSVADGRSLWADKFDEKFTDIFAVEDSISEKVAGALALKLTGAEKQRLTKRYTENVEAYHAYLKGRYFWYKRTEEALRKSLECFNQALAQDPLYAVAYDGLSDAYALLALRGVIPAKEAFLKAKAAARKALEIDDALGEAYASLAHVRLHDWDWAGLEAEFNRALDLSPGHAIAYHWYAEYLTALGRADESIAIVKKAQALDPLSSVIKLTLADAFFFARKYDQAIAQLQAGLELDPNHFLLRLGLGRAYLQKGLYEAAIEEMRKAVTLSGRSTETLAGLGQACAAAGMSEATAAVLDELNKRSEERYVSPYYVAKIYAAGGEKEQAFAWLEKAYAERNPDLIELSVEPLLDNLRSDPRFTDLRRRVGLAS